MLAMGVCRKFAWIPAYAGMTNGACRGAKPLCVSSLSPKTGGSKGVDQATYGNRTIIPTGQWSDPVTSGMMKALVTDGTRFFVTKK